MATKKPHELRPDELRAIAAGQLGAARRWHGPNAPETVAAEAAFNAARREEVIAALVAEASELSDDELSRFYARMRPVSS